MAKKSFTTTINEEISAKFKESCSNAGISMNVVLESLMQGFIDDRFTFVLHKGKLVIIPAVEPDKEDIAAIKRIESCTDNSTISIDELKQTLNNK